MSFFGAGTSLLHDQENVSAVGNALCDQMKGLRVSANVSKVRLAQQRRRKESRNQIQVMETPKVRTVNEIPRFMRNTQSWKGKIDIPPEGGVNKPKTTTLSELTSFSQDSTPHFARNTKCSFSKQHHSPKPPPPRLPTKDIRNDTTPNFAKITTSFSNPRMIPVTNPEDAFKTQLRTQAASSSSPVHITKDIRSDTTPNFAKPTKAFQERRNRAPLSCKKPKQQHSLTTPYSPNLFTKRRLGLKTRTLPQPKPCRSNLSSQTKPEHTVPKEFRLHTASRSRTTHIKSAKQLEEEFLSNIKPFKARPVMFSKDKLCKVEKQKKVTKIEPFRLRTEFRTRQLARSEKRQVKKTRYLSRNQSARLFERSLAHKKYQEQRIKQVRMKQQQELDQQSRFKALPMPDFSAHSEEDERPGRVQFKPTQAVSPTVLRRSEEAERRKLNLRLEAERQAKLQTRFVASELPSTTFEPGFIPMIGSKEPIKAGDFVLRSDLRAMERRLFDQKIEQQQREQDKLIQAQIQYQQEQQQKQLREYRRNLVHHPLPLPTEYAEKTSTM